MGLFRDLFGPSKEEIWQQLSTEMKASFHPGTFWQNSKLQVFYGSWTVTLDTFTTGGKHPRRYTRLRAPYVNSDGFQFTIYRAGLFSDLGRLLGMQDVEVGHEEFDSQFVIQGNDEKKLIGLFANERLRMLLSAQPGVYLTVKDDEGWFGETFPQGVDELYFKTRGIVKDLDQLRDLYALFAEVLDQLTRIGSAEQGDPGITL